MSGTLSAQDINEHLQVLSENFAQFIHDNIKQGPDGAPILWIR